MPRATTVLRRCSEAIKDSALLKVLRSEINHELSSNQFENHQRGSLGDFTLDWDTPNSQDVVLRKKYESGEEVAVSALLGPKSLEGSGFPRDVVMKVCIKKPGLCSVLLFDCGVWSRSYRRPDFKIRTAYYLPSSVSFDHSDYRGPLFSTLDLDLQVALKVYLEARGIGEDLMNFLLLHLHRKELQQYVNWLHKIEKMLSGVMVPTGLSTQICMRFHMHGSYLRWLRGWGLSNDFRKDSSGCPQVSRMMSCRNKMLCFLS